MEGLISIIIPIYGVEKYLDRCIKSVVNQTYKSIEIILVDDGSPDKCPQICDEWASRDSRIKVVHKKNGGLSDARNAGMHVATGDFIGFVDSDDFIHSRMYEELINIMLDTDSDVSECNYSSVTDNSVIVEDDGTTEYNVYSAKAAIKELIQDGELRQTVWNKLYKRKALGQLSFLYGKTNEDEYWTYKVFYNCKRLVKVNNNLYYYYQRSNSIIGSEYSLKRLDSLDAKKERCEFLQKEDQDLYFVSLKDLAHTYFFHFQKLCQFNKLDSNRRIRKTIHKEYCGIDSRIVFMDSTKKEVLWDRLFRLMPYATCRIRNILKVGL